MHGLLGMTSEQNLQHGLLEMLQAGTSRETLFHFLTAEVTLFQILYAYVV